MIEEEKKTIEDFKRVIANYFSYSSYDWFYSDLVKTGIKGTIQNTFADMINLIEKLQKENEELKNKVVKRDIELIKLEEYANKNFERKDDVKAKYIPKDKIRDFIKRLEKDVENIREKKKDSHDYDRSSSRIQAYLTKTNEIIKRLKELLEEE